MTVSDRQQPVHATQARLRTKDIVLAGALWLTLAVIAGAVGGLAQGPARLPQVVLLSLTAALLLAVWLWRPLRLWALNVDVRVLVLLHVTRYVGFYFLVLYQRGELPYDFAVKGGWGDVIVATFAILVALRPRRLALLAWNALGLADILFVVATAARLATAEPGSMDALRHLPLSLLATFLVPLIIVSHFVMFARLATAGRGQATR